MRYSILYIGAISASLCILSSCKSNTDAANNEKVDSDIQWVDPNDIQPSPVRHETLSDDHLTRIKDLYKTFADVDGTSLEKWISDFKRDADPEGNIKIWEDMQYTYKKYCDDKNLTLESRKEVFKVVLLRSMVSETEVLRRINLTKLDPNQAKIIMKAYPSAPKPIEVIKTR